MTIFNIWTSIYDGDICAYIETIYINMGIQYLKTWWGSLMSTACGEVAKAGAEKGRGSSISFHFGSSPTWEVHEFLKNVSKIIINHPFGNGITSIIIPPIKNWYEYWGWFMDVYDNALPRFITIDGSHKKLNQIQINCLWMNLGMVYVIHHNWWI